jgi:hypothetical protein
MLSSRFQIAEQPCGCRRPALTVLSFALLFSTALPAASEPGTEAEAVVAPGQEELLADMLGRGAAFPGPCAFGGGQADGGVIRSTYECPDGEVVIELRHASKASAGAARTALFALTVVSGSPPPGFQDALEAHIGSRESAFEWTRLQPPPTLPPAPPSSREPSEEPSPGIALLAVAGLLTLAGLVWVGRRRARWPSAALRLVRDPMGCFRMVVRDERFWAVIILVASAIARGWISVVNRESNDDHFGLARMIREGGWVPPASSECMLCSHAKLYHYVLAFFWELTGSESLSRIAGNLLNFAAGTVLLILFFAFSRRVDCRPQVRILALAFMSFNGALVGIFSQTTNDGFSILFSSLAIFYVARFCTDLALRQVVAATLFVILASLSKASGWAIFASGAAVLCLKLAAAGASLRRRYAAAIAVFVLGFLCVVPFVNPYRDNIARFHTPFVNHEFEVPLLKIEVTRPAWVYEDLLTFRIFDLVRNPYVDFHSAPRHRGSLWSQLYGKTFFLRFEQWIWESSDPRLFSLGRLCLVLGLMPLAALLAGATVLLWSTARGVSLRGFHWFAERHDWQHLVYTGAMLASLIALVITYRRQALHFVWMKVIYLLPAVLSFYKLFLDGLERMWLRWPRLVTGWMVAMVAASIVNAAWLIADLIAVLPYR